MRILVQNRKAHFNYQIFEKLEAGIKLLGIEVKAIINGKISIDESWIRLMDPYVLLVGATITPIKVEAWEKYEPTRNRILLLRKHQIKKLGDSVRKGFTIVPLKFYFSPRNLIKVEIAVVKGKKSYDKRKTIIERDIKRYGN